MIIFVQRGKGKTMSTIEIETDDNFESCNDCIHCDDTEEICKKRRCIHAIDIGKIRECYAPKEQYISLDKIKKAREEMQKLRGCSCSCSDGIINDVEDILEKLIESEE